jgi:predicted nucleic acid-binding protein
VTLFVVDASVAIEYLLRTPLGLSLAETLEEAELSAPDLIDAEVMSVLRHSVLTERLAEGRAQMALEDLTRWPVERIPSRALTRRAWHHRRNVTAYDALYVAAADTRKAPLLTADGRLARAPGLGITIQHFRIS